MSALLDAAKFILARNMIPSDKHHQNCKCRGCTEGPYIVHERCNLRHVDDREGVKLNGVEITCTCGLSALAKAVREEEAKQ